MKTEKKEYRNEENEKIFTANLNNRKKKKTGPQRTVGNKRERRGFQQRYGEENRSEMHRNTKNTDHNATIYLNDHANKHMPR